MGEGSGARVSGVVEAPSLVSATSGAARGYRSASFVPSQESRVDFLIRCRLLRHLVPLADMIKGTLMSVFIGEVVSRTVKLPEVRNVSNSYESLELCMLWRLTHKHSIRLDKGLISLPTVLYGSSRSLTWLLQHE